MNDWAMTDEQRKTGEEYCKQLLPMLVDVPDNIRRMMVAVAFCHAMGLSEEDGFQLYETNETFGQFVDQELEQLSSNAQ